MTYFNKNICLYNLTIDYIVQTVTKHKIALIWGFTVHIFVFKSMQCKSKIHTYFHKNIHLAYAREIYVL